jgi:hypothetical protein
MGELDTIGYCEDLSVSENQPKLGLFTDKLDRAAHSLLDLELQSVEASNHRLQELREILRLLSEGRNSEAFAALTVFDKAHNRGALFGRVGGV